MNTLAVTLQQSSAVSQAIYGNIILLNRNKAIIIVMNICNRYISGLKLYCIHLSTYVIITKYFTLLICFSVYIILYITIFTGTYI